jgi:hypothetical protein
MRGPRSPRALLAACASACVIAVAAAACGTSSSNGPHAPSAPTAAQLARDYDSLATVLYGAGTQSDSFRAEIVAVLNGVNADGVAPTTVSLTVASDTATWFANVADLVDSGAADSLQIYTLWSSTSVAEANITVFSFGTVSSSQSIAAGGDLLGAASASLTESTAEVSGSCTFTPVMHVYAPYPTYDPGLPCALDDAVLSGTIVDRPDTTATSRIASIVIPSTTIHGVRLQFPHYAFLRVRSLLTRAGTPSAAREGGVTPR